MSCFRDLRRDQAPFEEVCFLFKFVFISMNRHLKYNLKEVNNHFFVNCLESIEKDSREFILVHKKISL